MSQIVFVQVFRKVVVEVFFFFEVIIEIVVEVIFVEVSVIVVIISGARTLNHGHHQRFQNFIIRTDPGGQRNTHAEFSSYSNSQRYVTILSAGNKFGQASYVKLSKPATDGTYSIEHGTAIGFLGGSRRICPHNLLQMVASAADSLDNPSSW
jgi:hypothetical protein